MGTWGVALFSDDLAADLRNDFRDLIGEGMTANAVVKHLTKEYSSSLHDPDEAAVFWLALAATGWRLGLLDDDVRKNAMRVIESGQDLARWENSSDRRKREQVLAKLRLQLDSPPPVGKSIPRTSKSASNWQVGEIVGFRLLSSRWVLLRVIGHHEDRGGRSAVCELLNWIGSSVTDLPPIESLSVRKEQSPRGTSQFLFQEPRLKKDKSRIVRTGIVSNPSQRCGGYTGFVWPFVDRLFREVFDLE
jgi:hypothetical protein